MSNAVTQRKKANRSVLEAAQFFLSSLLGAIAGLYVILIVGIMPFYFTEGFSRIGTDKITFYSKTGVIIAKIAIPVLICYLPVRLLGYLSLKKKGKHLQHEQDHIEKKGKSWQTIFKRASLSITDVFVILYGVSLVISYAFSVYKNDVIWGADGWYMGFWPQMMLVGSYFLISRFWCKSKWMFYLIFPVSGVVFLLGVLNRFDIFPMDMAVENVQFLSTVGNINWYCGYLVTVFFGGVFLVWQDVPKKSVIGRSFLILYCIAGFATTVTQGSTSGIVTLVLMFLMFFCLSAVEGERMRHFFQIMLILWSVCLAVMWLRMIFPGRLTYTETATDVFTYSPLPVVMIIVSVIFYLILTKVCEQGKYPKKLFQMLAKIAGWGILGAVVVFAVLILVNTLAPGCLGSLSKAEMLTFSPEWGSNRGATWSAGVLCFGAQDILHKLFGVGPDGLSAFLYRDGSEALLSLVQERFGGATLTNAHNEWLTVLVNTGIFGFVSFVGIMVSSIVRYMKRRNANVIVGAAGFCLLAYTLNNMFSFQQAMNVSVMFVLLGMGEACMRIRLTRGIRISE